MKPIALAVAIAAMVSSPMAWSAIGTSDLTTQTATDVANALVGTGVTISNVTYVGADIAAGTFLGGSGIIGFDAGVILSSGNIASVVGPNISGSTTTANGTPGDSDLDTLSGVQTFDAAVLEFDFVPDANNVFFQYVFSSEEYNEYVNAGLNDTFGFLINDGTSTVNCAVVNDPPVPVSIDTINLGSNAALYINNDIASGAALDTEMDGLTVVLTCDAAVVADATNHMKLAIADGGDDILDSNVFIEENSITTEPPGPDTCPLSQGYWKNHADFWPVEDLLLGDNSYTKEQLLELLNMPVKGDASLILAKQLIAAKLNIANGGASDPVAGTIIHADDLIGTDLIPMKIKPSKSLGKLMTSDASMLDEYNNGELTPEACTTLVDLEEG